MNVTISLPDDLVKEAKHAAVDDGVSLSKYIACMLEKNLPARRDRKAAARRLREIMDQSLLEVGEITWTRDDLHERR